MNWKFLLTLLIPMIFFPGCASMSNSMTTSLATKYITMKTIEKQKNPAVWANSAKETVAALKTYVNDAQNGLTLNMVEAEVRRHVKWEKLAPSDKLAVDTLITAAKQDMQIRLTNMGVQDPTKVVLNPQMIATLNNLFDDILLAIQLEGY